MQRFTLSRAFHAPLIALTTLTLTGLVAGIAPAAHAQNVVNYGVTFTAASPSFNRPVSTTALSGVGTNVHYQSQGFTVNTTGTYALATTTAALAPGTAMDTFLCLYSPVFLAASPLTNILAVNDDDTAGGTSPLSVINTTLTSNTPYFLVTTTYTNAAIGTINSRITGPTGSTVSLIAGTAAPEPGSLAFATAILPLVGGVVVRRKRRAKAV